MSSIKINVEKKPKCKGVLTAEIPREMVNSYRKSILQRYTSQVKLPGFRKGHIPNGVIEKHYGEEINEQLNEHLRNQSFRQALEDENLKILNFKEPSEETISPEGHFKLNCEFILTPNFELPKYKEVEIKIVETTVKPSDVEETLSSLQKQQAQFKDITDRSLESEDLAVINYQGFLGKKTLEESLGEKAGFLAAKENYWVKMTEDSFLPGFCSGLEGVNIGETRDIQVQLNKNFHIKELAKKKIKFSVTVQSIKTEELPDINDKLANKIVKGKNLEQLKELISAQLNQENQRKAESQKTDAVLDKIVESTQMELPEELVEQEADYQIEQTKLQFLQQGLGDTLQEKELRPKAVGSAKKQLKSHFILREIARVESIEVQDNEIVAQISQIAQQYQQTPEQLIKQFQKEGRIPGIKDAILREKTTQFLTENAIITTTTN